jgi:hypothetical protein
LVGQAISLPRALGSFRAVGWDMIPYPAGYYSAGAPHIWPPDLATGLKLAALAAHVWAALILYRLMGYTNDIFPG